MDSEASIPYTSLVTPSSASESDDLWRTSGSTPTTNNKWTFCRKKPEYSDVGEDANFLGYVNAYVPNLGRPPTSAPVFASRLPKKKSPTLVEKTPWSANTSTPPTSKRGAPPSPDIEKELNAQNLYKTELCRPFEETGSCRYGSKCQFAHGKAELRPVLRHPKYKTEICKTFHNYGNCPYGARCRFIHRSPNDEIGLNSIFYPPPPPFARSTSLSSLWRDVVQKKSSQYMSSCVDPEEELFLAEGPPPMPQSFPGLSTALKEPPGYSSALVEDDLDPEEAEDDSLKGITWSASITVVPPPSINDNTLSSWAKASSDHIRVPSWRTVPSQHRDASPSIDPPNLVETEGTRSGVAKISSPPSIPTVSLMEDTRYARRRGGSGTRPPLPLKEIVESARSPSEEKGLEGRRRGSSGSRLPVFQRLAVDTEEGADYQNLATSIKEDSDYMLDSH